MNYTANQHLVVLGSGWGGFEFSRGVNRLKNYFVFTPLLASTSVGTLEHRCVTESLRRTIKDRFTYHQALCQHIDWNSKKLLCSSSLKSGNSVSFEVLYDKLIIAVGAKSGTFGIQGVEENAFFLKDIRDARRIRQCVLECFERAKQPRTSDEEIQRLLHFCIVGGGPTGIEFSAELHDLVKEDLSMLYPDLQSRVKISVYDVAKRILSGFDVSLAEYAARKFARQGIEVLTGVGVKSVTRNSLIFNDGSVVYTGMVVWATGLAPIPLVESSKGTLKDARTGRLLTDEYLRVLDDFGKPNEDVFAIGDCATIKGNDLPCTAQVAKQKAKHLKYLFNSSDPPKPFIYRSMGSMAYIGGWRAIVDLHFTKKHPIRKSGWLAWLFWRSAYFSMAVSWRNKILIPMYWFLTWAFGRDTTKI